MPYKKALKGLEKAVHNAEIENMAKEREKEVLFYQKDGFKVSEEAFGVKRSRLINWQRKYKEIGISGLIIRLS
jgi:hypothetical protein